MPGDLNNPEMMFPFHNDPRYEPGTNTFDSRPLNIKDVIQSIARKKRGYPLSNDEVDRAYEYLNGKNLLQRNPGEQIVQKSVGEFMKSLTASRKVIAKWCFNSHGLES
jgi:hypothetical protein